MGTVYFVNLDCDPETDKKFHWDYYYYCGIVKGNGGIIIIIIVGLLL